MIIFVSKCNLCVKDRLEEAQVSVKRPFLRSK